MQSKDEHRKIPFFILDYPKPRLAHRSPVIRRLADLKPGQHIVHDHSGHETSISLWLAQLRRRLKQNFRYQAINGQKGKYFIWLQPLESKKLDRKNGKI